MSHMPEYALANTGEYLRIYPKWYSLGLKFCDLCLGGGGGGVLDISLVGEVRLFPLNPDQKSSDFDTMFNPLAPESFYGAPTPKYLALLVILWFQKIFIPPE